MSPALLSLRPKLLSLRFFALRDKRPVPGVHVPGVHPPRHHDMIFVIPTQLAALYQTTSKALPAK
jgi:hypothetical protein